ncbi:uncharacterized protein SOCEGT47_011830 [Sorangium cellulosum]|uniref:Endonuclease GajA/Old nuclease/RecF-like AAA domain-containing protein n=1 Tax=Sorangium cellulosum TaxID=56 RepID=A0A4P2PVN0_SORCE|nr:ATP-binding protein [Sorangium cellulosum]AUX20710.1 uncharacterized protein SOCEGT47_011830 [Sorangium cellulosum]
MRLSSFHVRGFKNFRQEIGLEELGTFNVIHGVNNVGKSNLLQAMELYFRLLGLERDGWLPFSTDRRIDDQELLTMGFTRSEIFNLEQPYPIELRGEVLTDPQELDAAGIRPLLPADRVQVGVVLQWVGTSVAYRVKSFVFADGTNVVSSQSSPEKKTFILRFAKFLMQNFLIRTEEAARFALIPVTRLLDPQLALALYDAKESSDIEAVRRWERFVEVMGLFTDILGDGAFVATYDRRSAQANLVYQTANARIPLNLLGSGVQQIVSLVGRLLMTKATIVGVEEPELNLRYSLQERLREIFTNIVGRPGGPAQLFLTSHSPAFETGSDFYFMEPTAGGPVVQRHGVEATLAAVDFPSELSTPQRAAARSYVSTEGVVRLPERVMRALGLPQGGGITFVDHDGSVEIMSNERFVDQFGLDRGEGDADQR